MVWLELDLIPRNMCEQAIEVDSHANGRFESDSICTTENISMTFDSHERAYIVRHMHIVSACNCGCETIWHYTAIGICDGGLPVSGAPTRSPCIIHSYPILKMPRSTLCFVYKGPNRVISIGSRKIFYLIHVGAAKWCGFLVYFRHSLLIEVGHLLRVRESISPSNVPKCSAHASTCHSGATVGESFRTEHSCNQNAK